MRTLESSTAFSSEIPLEHIVLKIFSGIDHRFADVGMGGEVHDRIHPAQNRRQLGGVRNVSHDQFEALGQRGVAGHQIVVDDGFVAAALERERGVTADVSCASNH